VEQAQPPKPKQANFAAPAQPSQKRPQPTTEEEESEDTKQEAEVAKVEPEAPVSKSTTVQDGKIVTVVKVAPAKTDMQANRLLLNDAVLCNHIAVIDRLVGERYQLDSLMIKE